MGKSTVMRIGPPGKARKRPPQRQGGGEMPAWMNNPKLRAAFLGGLREAATFQMQREGQERREAEGQRRYQTSLERYEQGRAENLRRFGIQQEGRAADVSWRQTLEKKRQERQQVLDLRYEGEQEWRAGAGERRLEQLESEFKKKVELEEALEETQRKRLIKKHEELVAFEDAIAKDPKLSPEQRKQAVMQKQVELGLPKKAQRLGFQVKEMLFPDGETHQVVFNPQTGQIVQDRGIVSEEEKPEKPPLSTSQKITAANAIAEKLREGEFGAEFANMPRKAAFKKALEIVEEQVRITQKQEAMGQLKERARAGDEEARQLLEANGMSWQ